MRIEEYADRLRPVGVLYVDVHVCRVNSRGTLEVLLLRRNPTDIPMPGEWQTVSGKLSGQERITEGMLRQVYKKTGHKVISLYNYAKVANFFDPYYDTVMLVPNAVAFIGTGDVIIDDTLHDTYQWVSPDESLNKLRYQTQRTAICAIKESFEVRGGKEELIASQTEFTKILGE